MSKKDESDLSADPSFAELIGKTKKLSQGPVRAEPGSSRTSNQRKPGAATLSSEARFRFPDPNESHLAAADGVSDAQLLTLRRGELEPEEDIDLHGLRREAAERLIATRIKSASARGLRCVLVVHGKGMRSAAGEAVLRDAVPNWLAKMPCAAHVKAFAPAPQKMGGEGATLVALRRKP